MDERLVGTSTVTVLAGSADARASVLWDLYGQYRSLVLYASAALLEGISLAGLEEPVQRLELQARRAASREEGEMDGASWGSAFGQCADATAELRAWIAGERLSGGLSAQRQAVRRTHLVFRSTVWSLIGNCEYAPCGTGPRETVTGSRAMSTRGRGDG